MIDKVIQEYDGSDIKLKYLCIHTYDAWGRNHLRISGGLNIILDGCSSDTFDSKTFLIAKNLCHFMHDSEGLQLICRNDEFFDKIINLLKIYCNETKKECHSPETKLTLRPDSPNFLRHLEEKRAEMVGYLNLVYCSLK